MSKHFRSKTPGPAEPETVRTTIVGGRPPQRYVIPRKIPRGLEVLIKKAAVDAAFKKLFLEKRADAAEAIGLKLTAAEEAMLAAVPLPQLEGIIAHTRISPKLTPVFLGYAAGAMLAALGTTVTVCAEVRTKSTNKNSEVRRLSDPKLGSMRKIQFPSTGIQADRPRTYREGSALYVGGDAAGVETRRPGDIEYILRDLFKYVEEEYDTLVKNEEAVPRGNVLVKFTITGDGKVEAPEIIGNHTGFPELGVKTLQLLKGWRFAPVKDGSATVVYIFRLNFTEGPSTGIINQLPLLEKAFEESNPPHEGTVFKLGQKGKETVPSWIPDRYGPYTSGLTGIRPDSFTTRKYTSPRSEPSVTTSEPGITGSGLDNPRRSPQTISRITLNNLQNVNNLYVNLLKKNPSMGSGKVVVRYDVTADGRVKKAAIISDTLNNAVLAGAVLSEISRWEFSRIDEGTVTVVQPFVFIDGNN